MKKYKKGQIFDVRHSRSGRWIGIATRDFSDDEEWYPLALHQDDRVRGARTTWEKGENMPARKSLCKIIPINTTPDPTQP